MAKSANADSVSAAIRPANYHAAVKLIGTIPGKKEKIASVNGEIGDIFAKIEGHKVNKVAARMFMMLTAKTEDRVTIMRDLNSLIDAAGDWGVEAADLVDVAEGKVVPLRVGAKAKGSAVPDVTGKDDGDGDDDKEDEPSKSAVAKRMADAKAKVRAHLGTDADGATVN